MRRYKGTTVEWLIVHKVESITLVIIFQVVRLQTCPRLQTLFKVVEQAFIAARLGTDD
jgi:hypothetical protein